MNTYQKSHSLLPIALLYYCTKLETLYAYKRWQNSGCKLRNFSTFQWVYLITISMPQSATSISYQRKSFSIFKCLLAYQYRLVKYLTLIAINVCLYGLFVYTIFSVVLLEFCGAACVFLDISHKPFMWWKSSCFCSSASSTIWSDFLHQIYNDRKY